MTNRYVIRVPNYWDVGTAHNCREIVELLEDSGVVKRMTLQQMNAITDGLLTRGVYCGIFHADGKCLDYEIVLYTNGWDD